MDKVSKGALQSLIDKGIIRRDENGYGLPPELDVHTYGVYRQDYDALDAGPLIGMILCALSGFSVGLVVGWLL